MPTPTAPVAPVPTAPASAAPTAPVAPAPVLAMPAVTVPAESAMTAPAVLAPAAPSADVKLDPLLAEPDGSLPAQGNVPGSAGSAPDRAAAPSLPPAVRRLAELFQLGADERRVLALLIAAPEPPRLSQAAATLGLEPTALLTMLAGNGPLRSHGLVEVDPEAELGFLRPIDLLYAGRGVHLGGQAALAEAELFLGQAPGLAYFAAPPPGTEWAKDFLQQDRALLPGAQGAQVPQAVELARERLIAPHPILLWLSQCAVETVLPLAQAVRLRLSRPVLFIDGAALAGWPTPQLAAALRRLRRDADLRGAAVVVAEAQLLGSSWLALAAPRPPGQTAPVVLCSSGALLPGPLLPAGRGAELVPQAATLRPAPSAPVAAGAAATGAAELAADDPAALASRDDARRRAAMDAARAMGKPIPPELLATAPPPAPPPAPAPPRPAAPAAVAPPASAPPPPAPAPSGAPRPVNPRLAAALAKAGLPPAGGTPQHSAPAPAAPVAAVAPSPAPADSTAAAPPTEVPADDQPPLPLADDAGLDELVRVARTTPNQLQRAELLRKLSGKKDPRVIQLFRANAQSPHPAVRAAAEEGMASLFGATWNRTRAIPPPVQPPRSDDGSRGPGGAF